MSHPFATQTFRTARISRVSLLAFTRLTTRHPSNLSQSTGAYHRVRDNGPDVLYSRADTGIPTGGFSLTDVTIGTGSEGRLVVDTRGTLICLLTRSDGVYKAVSNDDGATWSTAVMEIPGGRHPGNRVGTNNTRISAAFVPDGSDPSWGTIQAKVYHPNGIAATGILTVTDETGEDVLVQDDCFGLDLLHNGAGTWLFHVLEKAATDTSEFMTHSETDLTVKRVV